MAASLFIEEESGTYTPRSRHPHNGYFAGDFSQTASGSELRPSAGTVLTAACPGHEPTSTVRRPR
jgi:hypothetical protein